MSSSTWDIRAEEDLNPSIATGVGNPLSPYNDEVLSEADEKRLDDKGKLIADGLLWSQASTDRYIWVALWSGKELTQLVPGGRAQSDIDLEKIYAGSWQLSIGVSEGKPRFNLPTVGAAFELPSDLGEDSIKRQYIAEWLSETVAESLENRGLPTNKQQLGDLALLVAEASNRAISSVL